MRQLLFLIIFLPLFSFSQTQVGQTLFGLTTNESLGTDLALSSNNSRIVILDNKNGGNNVTGHVKVFDNINDVWSQVGQTINIQALGLLNNVRTDISADGQKIAVASFGNSNSEIQSGSVRVFELVDTTWTQIGQEIFPLTLGEMFCYNISLSSDGTTLACGAPNYSNNDSNSGYVRVFYFNNNIWEEKGSIIEGVGVSSKLGTDVSISSDGTILVCSAPGNLTTPGVVRIFEYMNDDWVETGIFNDVSRYLCLTPDGQTIVISNSSYSDVTLRAGRVRVYKKINNIWTQIGSDLNGAAVESYFGETISISDDGTVLAIGAPRHTFTGDSNGYINLYKIINDDWVLFGEQFQGINESDYVGRSFALSPDGTLLGIGFQYDDTNATNSGKVITYDLTSVLSVEKFGKQQFTIYPNPTDNQFTIKLNESVVVEKINIYTNLGQFIKTTQDKIINISKLSSGLYYVEIITNKGKATKKLMVD